VSCENVNLTALKKVDAEITSEMKCFLYLEKKKHFYDETIGEGILTCYEMLMACHGYKSHYLWMPRDQLYDVESNKLLQRSPVILILYHIGTNLTFILNYCKM
jgi:hypothetical protein